MSKATVKATEHKPAYPKAVDKRLEQIRFTMTDLKVDSVVVTYLPNIRYLTNFSGSSAVLFITEDELHFFTDDRYEEQIKSELFNLPNFQTYITRDVWKYVKQKKVLKKVVNIVFESDRVTYADAVAIRNQLRPLKFKPGVNVVERFTIPKSPEELEYMTKACEITLKTFDKVVRKMKNGVSERDLAIEIAYQSRLLGSEGDPFDIIVTSGPRGALVHGMPSDRKIKPGDLVIFDFGCKVHGFCSDLTRTVAFQKASKEQKSMYKILVKAKDTAIANVMPGMNGKTLDEFARAIIRKEGFGQYFQHSLGHGIGLVPHEMPTITFRLDDQIVPEGAVIAIEPGIYLPDKFGMRVEDLAIVTRNGGKPITKAPAELPVVG
ncbi:MAG: aminopeptidase P family protein [Bacteroidetes bacterium]|nr:MAG: aminopeptidase P family protein [Bacteroidota bacterium]